MQAGCCCVSGQSEGSVSIGPLTCGAPCDRRCVISPAEGDTLLLMATCKCLIQFNPGTGPLLPRFDAVKIKTPVQMRCFYVIFYWFVYFCLCFQSVQHFGPNFFVVLNVLYKCGEMWEIKHYKGHFRKSHDRDLSLQAYSVRLYL